MSLRVVMVVDRFPNETFLAQQVASLIDRSIDVHVLCQTSDPAADAWALLDGVDMAGRIHPWAERRQALSLSIRAGTALATAATRDRTGLRLAGAAERRAGPGWAARALFDSRLVALEPDLVHFQFADLARRRVHLTRAVDTGFSSSFRGYDLAYAGLDRPDFYDPLWPVLDGAHTLGPDLRELAHRRGCPADLDWTIIPPAVDLTRFSAPERQLRSTGQRRAVEIVSVGRLHWKKGHLDALDAVARLRADGIEVRYRIIGAGPDEEQVRWAVRDLDLADCVELCGSCRPDQVRDHLATADIFLHAALTEGFGNAVLEAQAMAVPVVCTDAEGLADNVEDRVTGFVVPRRRPEALAAKLMILAADPGLRLRMGAEGRRRVGTRFGLAAQTEAFVEFFHRSVDRSRRRRGSVDR